MTADSDLQELRLYWSQVRNWSHAPKWSYSWLEHFDWEGDPKPTQEQFDAFTAEISNGERCDSCGGDDYHVMEDGDEVVHYDCGKAWSNTETLVDLAKRRAVKS